jgi:hypothetical protein
MSRWSSFACSLVVAVLASAAPAAGLQAQDVWREIAQGQAMAPTAYIRIFNLSGSIRIIGWDRDSVAVTGRAQSGAGRFFLAGDRESSKIGFEMQEEGRGELTIRVPARSTVWVKTASASIDVEGMTGGLDVYSVSGPIAITGALRQLNAESLGGNVEIEGSAMSLRARSGGGSVVLIGGGEDVTLSTVEGALRVVGSGIRRGRFETVSGTLLFEGGVGKGSSLSFQTHSGNAELNLSASASFDADLSTFEGDLGGNLLAGVSNRSDPLQGRKASVSRGGGADVTVRTFSGDIILRSR